MTDEDPPETQGSTPEDSTNVSGSATKAPSKDRQCPFCGQAFTSSSLGRHLDLYIRPKNPKPADGVHDVDEIRKLRGGITRRQPKSGAKTGGSNGSGHRDSIPSASATPSAPPRSVARAQTQTREPTPTASPSPPPPEVTRKAESEPPDAGCSIHNAAWQATGVINNLPPRAPTKGPTRVENVAAATGQSQRITEMRQDAGGNRIPRPEYETEGMVKLQEAAELGRAAEMALREVLGSLEAAQKAVKPKSLYEDFDFYELSFPGLCLAILPPPGTLFSSTPFPSAESWTMEPPGLRQYETMCRFLNTRISGRQHTDKVPDAISFRHHAHLSGAWEHWQTLSISDRQSAWTLEILRSFTRSQDKVQAQRLELEKANQRISQLEAEFDRLARCQLPREYLMRPPNTTFVPSNVMREVKTSAPRSDITDANYDAETLISKWRSTIRAIPRPPRPGPQHRAASPSSAPTTTIAASKTAASDKRAAQQAENFNADIIMNGAVWGVGGRIPRNRAGWNEEEIGPGDAAVSYETPPEPGVVMSAEDSLASPGDEDASGEAEEGYEVRAGGKTNGNGNGNGHEGALMRRKRGEAGSRFASPRSGLGGGLNGNGKRPADAVGGQGGRGQTKLYRGQAVEQE